MRSSGGTNVGLERSVVTRTKSTIACFAGPSFHDDSSPPDVVVCACAEAVKRVPDKAGSTANDASRARRFVPKEIEVGFILIAPQTRDVVPGCLPVRFQCSAGAICLPDWNWSSSTQRLRTKITRWHFVTEGGSFEPPTVITS